MYFIDYIVSFFVTSKPKQVKKVKKSKVIIDYKKKNIPRALREQVWLVYMGKIYKGKCFIKGCENEIDVFNYHVGHDIPEVKGGNLDIKNLKPLCARCNLSMSKNYTIDEWVELTNKNSTCNIL